jgi:hypothetical protein
MSDWAIIFAIGFAVGFGVREVISRRRHAKSRKMHK